MVVISRLMVINHVEKVMWGWDIVGLSWGYH